MKIRVHLEANGTRKDIDVFDLKLIHKEGSPATLRLMLSLEDFKEHLENTHHRRVFLEYGQGEKTMTLFAGEFVPPWHWINEDVVHVDFVAQAHTLSQDWPAIQDHYFRTPPFFDPLFQAQTPEDHLKSRPMVLYWDRVTGQLSLSPIVKEARDTLSTHQHEMSFEHKPQSHAIELQIQAQWIQKLQGFKNVYPIIAKHFDCGTIHSLTGDALKKSWPKPGTGIGQSGYHVIYSQLCEIMPPPGQQNLVTTSTRGDRLVMKKTWFDGELVVGYNYRQKRQQIAFLHLALEGCTQEPEKISFSLGKLPTSDDVAPFLMHTSYVKSTKIHYEGKVYEAKHDVIAAPEFRPEEWHLVDEPLNIFQEDFFLTDRGKDALAHGLQRAKTALAWNSRSLTVRLRLDLDQGAHLTLDDALTLKDIRLPGHQVTGKVVMYDLSIKGKTGETSLWITLSCRVERRIQGTASFLTSQAQSLICHGHSLFYTQDAPCVAFADKLKNPVEKVVITNAPQAQYAHIQNLDKADTTYSLRGQETRLSITFASLRGQECQTRHLYLYADSGLSLDDL